MQVGIFYIAYGQDALLLSSICGFKLVKLKKTYKCGFPGNSFNKWESVLINHNCSYVVVAERDKLNGELKERFLLKQVGLDKCVDNFVVEDYKYMFAEDSLLSELKSINLINLTPLEAFNMLDYLQKKYC